MAVVLTFATAEREVLSRLIASARTVLLFNLVVGVSGLVVFYLASVPKVRRRRTDPEYRKREMHNVDYHPLHFFREATYWGTVTFLVMAISSVIPAYSLTRPKVKVAAKTVALPPSPVKFPPMQIQGIVLRGPQSSVMIEGKIYFIGEHIGDVRVVAIDKESVTLELSGQSNVLYLPK